MVKKGVILAGGYGTRISEESDLKPKPMIEMGGKPLLWHVLKIYSAHGIREFIICGGCNEYVIKEYFANYFLHMSDVTLRHVEEQPGGPPRGAEPWRVTPVETGLDTMTGGRPKRVRDCVSDEGRGPRLDWQRVERR